MGRSKDDGPINLIAIAVTSRIIVFMVILKTFSSSSCRRNTKNLFLFDLGFALNNPANNPSILRLTINKCQK